jgi:hypothetical protein
MTEFKFGPEHVGQTFKRRDGRVVEIVAHVPRALKHRRVVALHQDGEIYSHCEDGRYVLGGEDARDIMPPLRTYYFAVCKIGTQYFATGMYGSEEGARQAAGALFTTIVTVELP